MSTSLNDRSANSLSDMAYIADKLGQIKDISKYDNISKIFYNDDGTLRTEFKDTQGNEISGLKEYAQRINANREMYSDVLGSKLVGTADDKSGYKGIAVQNSDGSITIASAGTDSAMDGVSDFQMAMGKIPLQLDSAKSFIEKLKNDKDENGNPIISTGTPIDFTGHSLGGSLSELLAVDLVNSGNIRMVKAFESFGVKGIIDNNPELAGKYYASQALIDGMVKSYVSEFDPCCNWIGQIGTPVDAFSKDGIYTQQNITKGGLFFHQLDRYGMLAYGPDGNIIQGQIDYKNLLKTMRNDPANLENYLALYDAVKGSEPYDPNGKNSLDNFVSDCLAYNAIDKLFPLAGTAAMLNSIMAANSQYKSAETAFITPPRRDPITVDLDNDGIETTDTAGGVYFDLDGNGTKEKTGWVKADDGFVVMDRDGNGTIDFGRELFGDQTIIKSPDGSMKTAETGFEALSAEDSNKDKVIDSSDENFSKLKVWKDANQDGVSQANELQSLEDAGIKKIHLDYLTVNADDGHGNIQTRTSGFEFADGRTGLTGEFLFNRDTIDTQNNDFSNVPADILLMPYLRGFGQVTDLYHAIASDESLKILVTEFCNTESTNLTNSTNYEPGTATLQISEVLTRKFEDLLFKWCGVDAIDANSRGGNINAKKLAVLEKFFAEKFEGFGAVGTGERNANPNAAAAAQLNTVYDNVKDRFLANMLLQSHLKEYVVLGAIELNENGEIKVNEQAADSVLNYQKTLTGEAYQLFPLKFYVLANVVKALGPATEKEEFLTYFADKGEGIYADGLSLLSTNKILIGGRNNDILTGDNSDNKIYGFDGNDTISGGTGNDILNGGDGNDVIFEEISNTSYVGGDDTLIGGKGDDYLNGGYGSNTYTYRKGDGNDTIEDSFAWKVSYDKVKFEDINPTDIYNTVKAGNDFIVTFKDTNGNPGEKITFKNWFYSDMVCNGFNSKIEEFEFADGTKWNTAQIEAMLPRYGTDGNDVINGSATPEVLYGKEGDDTISGLAGNDKLFGDAGNDNLYGNEGDDTLDGREGNDVLEGGKGNDILSGGGGIDTYIYNKGDGSDVITDGTAGKLEFKDILSGDVNLIRRNSDLVIGFKDSSDTSEITLQKYFLSSNDGQPVNGKKISEIKFADGTIWTPEIIEQGLPVYGTDGKDTLHGTWKNEAIYGGKGADSLYGDDGNDVLEGNAENDILTGGAGSDTYVYKRGDGNDVINDFDDSKTASSSIDTLRLEGFRATDVKTKIKSGSDLILQLYNIKKSDYNTITLKNYYASDATGDSSQLMGDNKKNYKVEKVVFDDGAWGAFELEDQVKIYGTAGDDVITGGIGGDIISSEAGNDIVRSGKGNDTITDTTGNDTYIYRKGDGNDTILDINDISKNGSSFDKLKLEGIVKEDIGEINRDGNDLVIRFVDSGSQSVDGGNKNADSIRIKSWFDSNDEKNSWLTFGRRKNYKIEEIEFSDGSKWGVSDIEQLYKYKITGNDKANKLGGKNDHGMIIEGKKGNDTITGGVKEDIYVVNSGDGNDVIKTTGGGEDTIRVNASSDSLSFKKMNASNMVMFLHDVNGSSSLTLTGYLDRQKHDRQKIKQVEAVSDGAILTEKNLQLLIQAMASFETEKGISWEKAVEQNDPKTKEILSQYWIYEKKSEE